MFEKPQSAVYRIYLLRHGQSTGNAQGVYQGQADYPLDETGIHQVQALATRWKAGKTGFDRIISSPLKRARQTAEIIAAALGGAPVDLDENWMERNNGALSGLTPEQSEIQHPRPAFFSPYTAVGTTCESNWLLYLRAGKAVDDLLRRPPGSYLVVSHGAILNLALYGILGIIPQASFAGARFRFSNAAFASLTYIADRHLWYLESVNDHSHWKDEN
mgnify:CR=1 FL=1